MFVGMAATAIISAWSLHDYHGSIQDVVTADGRVKAVALVLFAALGFPLAVSITLLMLLYHLLLPSKC